MNKLIVKNHHLQAEKHNSNKKTSIFSQSALKNFLLNVNIFYQSKIN